MTKQSAPKIMEMIAQGIKEGDLIEIVTNHNDDMPAKTVKGDNGGDKYCGYVTGFNLDAGPYIAIHMGISKKGNDLPDVGGRYVKDWEINSFRKLS